MPSPDPGVGEFFLGDSGKSSLSFTFVGEAPISRRFHLLFLLFFSAAIRIQTKTTTITGFGITKIEAKKGD